MVVPIVFYVAASAAVTAAGTGLFVLKWRQIVGFFAGKPIAVLGMRGTGKSTLWEFMTHGSIPKTYAQTRVSVGRSSGGSKIFGGIKVKSGDDVGGDISLYPQWHAAWVRAALEGGFVLYVVDGAKVFEGDERQLDRINLDATRLMEWVEERSSNGIACAPKLVVIGTHADTLDRWNADSDPRRDEFARRPELDSLRRVEGFCGVVLGSLANRSTAADLVLDVAQCLGGTPRKSRR